MSSEMQSQWYVIDSKKVVGLLEQNSMNVYSNKDC